MDYFLNGKHLFNDATTVTSETLQAYVINNPSLAILDVGNVIIRRDYNSIENVRVISGGGYGHDPAYAGYVGKGMLTAAVQGDIFNAPPAKIILRTIKELCLNQENAEMLIIIRNDRGNRMNFGLAAERARNDKIRAKVLLVGDNCCKNTESCGKGLTGVIVIQKIAGAMAEEGKSLKDILYYCQLVETKTASILLCIKHCSTHARDVCTCLKGENDVEIGTGIYGEPGDKKLKITKLSQICKVMLSEIAESEKINFKPQVRVVVLVNNLGTLSKMEEMLFLKEVVSQLQEMEITISRAVCGRFFTCLDMSGVTLTVVEVVDDDMLKYLDAHCLASAWSKLISQNVTKDLEDRLPAKFKSTARKSPALRGPKLSNRASNILTDVVTFACDALISCEKQLNTIDSERGDGDTGARIKRGAEAILNELAVGRLKTTHPFTFFQYISRLLEVVMGGTLGCVYSIFFEALSGPFSDLPGGETLNAKLWLKALKQGADAMKYYLNVNHGDRTMYDPLYECYSVTYYALCKQSLSVIEAFGEGVSAAEITAKNTVSVGRKYPDSGAHAVGIWLRACYEAVKLRWDENTDESY